MVHPIRFSVKNVKSKVSQFPIFIKFYETDSKVSTRDAVEKQADRRAIKIFNILSELKF